MVGLRETALILATLLYFCNFEMLPGTTDSIRQNMKLEGNQSFYLCTGFDPDSRQV